MHASVRFVRLVLLVVLAFTTLTMGTVGAIAQGGGAVSLEPVIENAFDEPMHVTGAGDGQLFVIERAGTVQLVSEAVSPTAGPKLFLDITDRVGVGHAEQGVLGIVLAPASHSEDAVYLSYTNRDGHSVISRFVVAEDGLSADSATESVVLMQEQPFPNHNGGFIVFGPDDMLYIAFGDGGAQGDPANNAQDPLTWLGKILRVDVHPLGLEDAQGYAIPADNPFVGDPAAAPEVWALGLQNPRHLTFDHEAGLVAISDVGRQAQEVMILPVDQAKGANFGWSIEEGGFCTGPGICDTSGMVDQTRNYDNSEGCAIAGGAFIDGGFLYADRCTGRVWVVDQRASGTWSLVDDTETGLSISSVGRGGDGAIFLTDTVDGSLYRLTTD